MYLHPYETMTSAERRKIDELIETLDRLKMERLQRQMHKAYEQDARELLDFRSEGAPAK